MTNSPLPADRPTSALAQWLRSSQATLLALMLILALGAYFRTINLFGWDASARLHPDERFMGWVASDVRVPDGCALLFAEQSGLADPLLARNFCDDLQRSVEAGTASSYDECSTIVARATGLNDPGMIGQICGNLRAPGLSERVREYFDSSLSRLNPRNMGHSFYVYGMLPISATRLLAETLDPFFETQLVDFFEIYKVGRALSTFVDLCALLLVFLIGRRLYGRNAGLLAALLAALSVLNIQLAHFFTVDTFTACLTLLAIYWMLRVAQGDGWLSYTMLGLAIGMAMSSRVTMAALGGLAILATALRVFAPLPIHPDARQTSRPATPAPFWNSALMLVLAGALTLLTFRVLQPDAFVGSTQPLSPLEAAQASTLDRLLAGRGFFDIRPEPRFLANIQEVSLQVTGERDFPPAQQWTGRQRWIFPYTNLVVWGMGLPLGILVTAGWALAGWHLLRRRQLIHLIPWLWVSFYFAWQGSLFGFTMRYFLPIYGLLIIFGARVLVGVPELWRDGWPGRLLRGLRSSAERWISGRAPRTLPQPRSVPVVLTLLVLLGTALWAYAFTRIYTVPHSRIEATRWIYEHIPPGSAVTFEEWDDPLPLNIDGLSSSAYVGIKTFPYAEDDPGKWFGNPGDPNAESMLSALDQADYLIFSSNRVYGSATRLPQRYPVLTRYYHYLFNGQLGFELYADITSYPRLFGIPIPDQIAEEAFSVYDHPRVLIFRKTSNYSRAQAERLLTEGIIWSEIYKVPSVTASKTRTALRLTDQQWPVYRDGGTWSQLFNPNTLGARLPLLSWLVLVELLGLAMFAILFRLLPALADRGFALAKMLAILLVGYGAWLTTSSGLLGFTPGNVWIWALLLLLIGAGLGWQKRAELRAFVAQRRSALLWSEGLFLAVFLLFVAIRWMNPDLWHPARGGEKPMDFAYLLATLKSSAFPPYDPWFAGGFMNYYYFGFVLVGALVHLSGVPPEVAYNLAVPLLAALSAQGAFGVVYTLLAQRRLRLAHERRAIGSGLLAALALVGFGNLAQAAMLLRPGFAAENAWRPEWAFWDATRVITGTVNEFPFFTFLFADLHAHMIALPLTLAAIGLQVALLRSILRPRQLQPGLHTGGLRQVLLAERGVLSSLLLLGLLLGALRAANTWDFPVQLVLLVLTLALAAWQRLRMAPAAPQGWQQLLLPPGRSPQAWPQVLVAPFLWVAGWSAALLGLSSLLFWPFLRSFATDYAGFERWTGELTTLGEALRVYGVWLLLLIPALLVLGQRASGWRWSRIWGLAFGTLAAVVLTALLTGLRLQSALPAGESLSLGAAMLQMPALFLLLPLLLFALLAGARLLWRNLAPRTALPLIWAISALGLALLVELIVTQGDIGRMNTVFKFGLAAWTLFALATGCAVFWLDEQAWRWHPNLRLAWRGLLVLVLGAALLYPLTATPARIADRFVPDAPRGLNGLAFLPQATVQENGQDVALAEDAAAIRWLRERVPGSPIVLEAHLEAYRWGARIANYTGLPTLLGWPWHQIQQRSVAGAEPVIAARQNMVREIYSSIDPEFALRQLQLYGVRYVLVGQLERAIYPAEGLAKFESLAREGRLLPVFAEGQTRIFEVPNSGTSSAILTTTLATTPPALPEQRDLRLSQPVNQLPVIDEYAWNPLGQQSLPALLFWLLALAVLTLLGLPLAASVFGRNRDGGYAWARLLGLLLLGYAVWLPVSANLWQYDRWSLVYGLLLVLLLNGVLLWAWGRRAGEAGDAWQQLQAGWRGFRAHLAAHRRAMLWSEGLFLVAFLVMAGLRALNPDLWQPIWGGEKPWEFGFLNAILRSPVMPPIDPFYSDGYINYYYYGLFLSSLPIKATGVAPAIGFNLVIASLFAFTAVGSFALLRRLTGRVIYGLAGVAGMVVLGNLASAIPAGWSGGLPAVLRAVQGGGLQDLGRRLDAWFVGPTRVIVEPAMTINEFPAFSFLFADLHPHLVALPITLLVIALAYELLVRHRQSRTSFAFWSGLGLAALLLGMLAATNSWDFPTYTLLIGMALLGAAYRRDGLRGLPAALLPALATPLLGLLLFLPFFQHYRAVIVSGIGLVTQGSTTQQYLLLYGLFVSILLPVILAAAWRIFGFWSRPAETPLSQPASALGLISSMRSTRINLAEVARLALTISPILLGLATWADPALGLKLWLATLLALGAAVLLERRIGDLGWFTMLLACAAWGVSLGMELVYIRDHLDGGEAYRMNTVFKFGLQVWVLLAIAAAAALPRLASTLRRLGPFAQIPGWLVIIVLTACAAIYPLAGPISRVAYRFPVSPPPTLDGLAFLERASFVDNDYSFDLSHDAAAINWLNANLQGTPIVLQSEREFYRSYGVRIAANTGLPTVLGALHANEVRPDELVTPRVRDVQAIYNTADPTLALQLLARYRVDYVYVGVIERAYYRPEGIAKFDTLLGSYLQLAYENPGVKIYQLNDNVRSFANLPPAEESFGSDNPIVNEPIDDTASTQASSDKLSALEALVQSDPFNAGNAFALGLEYVGLGRLEDAARVLSTAMPSNPNDVGLHHFGGDILAQLGRYDEAERAYAQAVAAQPTSGNLNKLGSALLAWGRLDKAEIALLRAIEVNESDPDPHFNLGMLYAQQDKPEQARAQLERYLQLAPAESPYRETAQRQLEALP